MAEDVNKKIEIEIKADIAESLKSIAALNQALDGLLLKQKQLDDAGQQNIKAFQNLATQVKTAQGAIDSHSKAITDNVKTLSSSNNTLKQNQDLMVALLQTYNEVSKSQGDHSKNVKALNIQIGTLSNTITGQVEKLNKSREIFDAHKATVNALGGSFDKLKDVSGIFGPSLQEAAKGFEALKSGLDIVKTGFTSVGAAIKTTGFGLLVLVLQSVVDYFTRTTEGSKTLKGAISAIGVVVEVIHKAFAGLGKIIVDAVSHPVESIQALGRMIWENIINRFKAFSVILDGIIHLDFKKVGDGIIQSFTGITNATDKIAHVYNTVVDGAKDTASKMVNAYKEGYEKAGKEVEKHEKKVIGSNKRIRKSHKKTGATIVAAQRDECKCDEPTQPTREELIEPATPDTKTPGLGAAPVKDADLRATRNTEDKKSEIKKTALQKVEDYAKQSGVKIATDALKTLTDSIKQQSEAKVAALEKDKAAELNNKSLTSAQKLAIENKYKKQEGAIKAKAFKEEQKLSIAQAIINGAQAVTKVSAQAGILAPLEIGVVIAETAAQVAKIASQKPPAYARGGLHYQSDGRGGVLPGYSRADNTNAYLRSGEGVVVSEAMQVPWARNLVSAINVGFGGRDFSMSNPGKAYAVGGIFTDGGDANRYYNQPVNDQKNLANSIAYQMINNFPPVYVDVKDINNQQNILAQTVNRVNL